MERTYIGSLAENSGKEVVIKGWVDSRRDHGKLIFLDIRDMTGYVQSVALPNHEEAHSGANELRDEWVVEVTGIVNERPEKMKNPEQPNGSIELECTAIKVLNRAETPAFDVRGDGRDVGEEHRLKYRYLDLRRPRMQRNIRERHRIVRFVRNYLSDRMFTEIETPLLTKSTPEGARDYIVPSRLEEGIFYALPQSPQQYKQLLMVSGFERYFQFAKCLRDEDTRKDRQPEFTQLDMELSFVEQEDVMALNEALLIELVETLYPDKKIQKKPFPRISYQEAMEKYGSDRPDIRENKEDPNELAFCWVVKFPFFEKTDEGTWTFTHNPFSAPIPEHLEDLMNEKNVGDILTTQYDIVLNGYEIGGGSIRAHNPETLKKVLGIIGYSEEEIENDFGHMTKALAAGAPPHGGIAWGLDRFVSLLMDEPNIREVIAFSKTGEGRDLMMGSPSNVKQSQLDELSLQVVKKAKK